MKTGIELERSTRVVASEPQTSATVGDEEVILHLDQSTYYGVNSVGQEIWAQIQEPTKVADIQEAIATAYDIDSMKAEDDVLQFLEALAAEGLIELSDA